MSDAETRYAELINDLRELDEGGRTYVDRAVGRAIDAIETLQRDLAREKAETARTIDMVKTQADMIQDDMKREIEQQKAKCARLEVALAVIANSDIANVARAALRPAEPTNAVLVTKVIFPDGGKAVSVSDFQGHYTDEHMERLVEATKEWKATRPPWAEPNAGATQIEGAQEQTHERSFPPSQDDPSSGRPAALPLAPTATAMPPEFARCPECGRRMPS